MKGTHYVNRFDSTDRPTADQSAQSAAGLGAGRVNPGDEEDIIARDRRSRGSAPRRYEVETDDTAPSDAPRRRPPA